MSVEKKKATHNNDDTPKYSNEEVEEWVQRDVKWEVLTRWQNYLLANRNLYLLDRQNALGAEYFSNTTMWDSVFEREWVIIEERMNAGIGVEEEVIEIFGKGFFKDKDIFLQNEFKDVEREQITTKNEEILTIYSFEDFIMLSNQGIFRDKVFLIDPQRKWKKKVIQILTQYGYNEFDEMRIKGEKYIVVTG